MSWVGGTVGPVVVLADRNALALLSTLEQALAWNGPLKQFDAIPYSTLRLHIDRIEALTGLPSRGPTTGSASTQPCGCVGWDEGPARPGRKWRTMAAAG